MLSPQQASFFDRWLNPKSHFRRHFIARSTLARFDGIVVHYHSPAERREAFERTRAVAREIETLVAPNEAYQLFSIVRRLHKIPGALAELGVYRGGTARMICEASDGRDLHLFDTFTGLPELSPTDDSGAPFACGDFAADLATVRENLRAYSNVRFHVGVFPESAAALAGLRFSFVHVDADLHHSTSAALEFFYPRMNAGGVMLFHDSIQPGGARNAVETFFAARPEPVLELTGNHTFVVKLRD